MSELLSGELGTLLAELKTGLKGLYGERLVSVILYGSQARGDATEDSDIDVLVVLQDNFDYSEEHERISFLTAALSLQYDTLISTFLTAEHDFSAHQSSFLQNVWREGVTL